jgi:hypothetical protein
MKPDAIGGSGEHPLVRAINPGGPCGRKTDPTPGARKKICLGPLDDLFASSPDPSGRADEMLVSTKAAV